MPYISQVYNVMLASPSDVSEERNVAREIIWDWNNIHSSTKNIVLLPLGWEYNAMPTMGDRPQEIINKQVLENADLLVGIFWTRIGTPTGKALSGSVEEIENHINSGKPAMLYFSNKAAVLSKVDNEQYQAVQKLKKEYQNIGLIETFDTVEDFKSKFQRHLSMMLNKNNFFLGYSEETNEISNKKGNNKLINFLTNEAMTLLNEATNDVNGQILNLSFIGGESIQTNGMEFIQDNNPKGKALWVSALKELEEKFLIKPTSSNKNIFEVTNLGYKSIEQTA